MDRDCSQHDLAPASIRVLLTRRLLLQGAAVLSGPDIFAFEPQGRLWIATDKRCWSRHTNPIPNGLYGTQVEGPDRAVTRFFYNDPAGAEMCGPEFTPDGQTLFVAVQHPSDELASKPSKSWPDFVDGVP